MESMRAVGYSIRTAIADIIDNSITAEATIIDIRLRSEGDFPYIVFIDDGRGMSGVTARHAMQLAGTYSSEGREESDLGRFGLGLKTASLSQCKRLTLVTKLADGTVTALVWDLDHIADTKQWSLLVLDAQEYSGLPGFGQLSSMTQGTLVLWEKLDRIGTGFDRSRALDAALVDVAEHVSLVFHRFLAGEDSLPKLRIVLNGTEIVPADPFLARSPRTQVSRREVLMIEGSEVAVQAFTLPYLNKMSASERKRAQVAGGIRDSQGFYIYRGRRLVIWGTWFRLMPKTDLGKLARVKVDIPNSLDHLWNLDIKKSSAVPPNVVRERLRGLATSMIEPSRRVHNFRGRASIENDPIIRPWTLVIDRDSFRYEVNRQHPALREVTDRLDQIALQQLDVALRILESTFPVQDLHNRMSSDAISTQVSDDLDLLRGILRELWQHRPAKHEPAAAFVTRMMTVEPLHQLLGERLALIQEFELLEQGTP